jgi:glycosyltransferase involved in cell wall biosynthesis
MKPISVLFIENSVGLSGSTVSLCTLLNYLDSEAFDAHIVLSRPEQKAYVLGQIRRPGDLTVIAPRRSLKESFAVQRVLESLEGRAPWLGRHILGVVGLLDILVVTLPYAFNLRRWAKNRSIEVIHQNNGFDLGALILSRLLRVPLVAYERGWEWRSPFVKLMAPRVTRYIANSESTKASLVSLRVPSKRITVIYPPLDLSTFHLPLKTTVSRQTFGLDPSAPCFGIVGMLLPWKGHEVFLKAAKAVVARVPNAHAFIVGAAPTADKVYERRLRALAHDLGIGDRVTFTGYRADIPDILTVLDVVIHASIQSEPFGRVITEAMAMKRPVVATKAGGPTEIIEDGRTGFLVPPGDHEAMADRIVALLEDRALAERVGDAGSREVARRFSADAHALLAQRVYEQVLRPRRVAALRERYPEGLGRHVGKEL